jgi:hypothetical protein
MFRPRSEGVPACSKIPNGGARHLHPLGAKQLSLQPGVPAEAAEPSGGGNNAVARDVSKAALAHDVAHRPGCSRMSSRRSDVAIRGDTARWNSSDDGQDAGGK